MNCYPVGDQQRSGSREPRRPDLSCRSSPCPWASALNSPYSLRYLAFRLPSRMPAPALRGPLVMSRFIINRSATYPCLPLQRFS